MFTSYLKTTFRYSVIYNIKRFISDSKANSQILCDYFGISEKVAADYVHKNKLYKKDPELILESIKICKRLGYSDEDIFINPLLVKTNPLILDQHYMVMEEGGFHNITPHVLAKARTYMNKMVKELKLLNLIKKDTDVQESFIKYIDPLPKDFHVEKQDENLPWKIIHFKIVKEFLKTRLETTDDEIIKLFRIHGMIMNKSFRVIQENIALATEMGFTPEKMLKYGYILHNYPQYTKTVLADFPNLAGGDMRVAMRRFPKLFMTSPRNILKIYGLLKEHNFPDTSIQKNMNIFHLSPTTVKLRLEEFETIPELKVMKDDPKILMLVVHHNRTKSRLSFMQKLQLRCTNLNLLGGQTNFDDHIKEGKDINSANETYRFLSNLFTIKGDIIRRRWKLHPFHLQVPFIDMEQTFLHLKELDFKTKDIYQCIHIILYPIEKINKALKNIRSDKQINYSSLNKVQILNLILYFIEKEYHFTGNGIWQKYKVPDTPETVLE